MSREIPRQRQFAGTWSAALVALLMLPLPAVCGDSAIEIGQLRIGMPIGVVEARLGEPFQVIKEEGGWEHRVYGIDPEINGYAVVSLSEKWPQNAVAIQYSGEGSLDGLDFHGLELGSSPDDVRHVLGEPDDIAPAGKDDWQLWKYGDHNYTIEVSPQLGMTSIRLEGFRGYWSSRGWPASFETYHPGSLADELAALRSMVTAHGDNPPDLSMNMMPARVLAVVETGPLLYEPVGRELSLVNAWAKARKMELPAYGAVASVREGGKEYRVLLQAALIDAWREEVQPGQVVFLFAMLLGAHGADMEPVFVANEFSVLPWHRDVY